MDPLENFISKNKDNLTHRPKDRDALWEKINLDIVPTQKAVVGKINWHRWAAVATIALVIGVGLFWIQTINGGSQAGLASEKSIEVLEIDAHYNKLINIRVMQVKNSIELTEQQKSEIIGYLDKLESESLDLEKELATNINNVQIIQAMIENYRSRLDVLETLLSRSTIQKNNNHERNISI